MTKMFHMSTLLTMLMITIIFMLLHNFYHPIIVLLYVISYTIITCIIMSMWSHNYMYSIILFLMMISGLLIIFLYFSSLISNEQNKSPINIIMITNLLMNLIIMLYLKSTSPNMQMINMMETSMSLNLNENLFNNVSKMYSYPFNNMTMLSMLYLLLALFMIIKICSTKSKSLRKIK